MKSNRALSAARASEDRQKCRDWLIPHMSDGKPKAFTKDQYRALARQDFSFATAAFNDAWIWAIEDAGRHDWYEGKGREAPADPPPEVDSLTVLDAERTLAGAEAEQAQADAQVTEAQIDLFRALGGGWQEP